MKSPNGRRAAATLMPTLMFIAATANAQESRWYAAGNVGIGNLSSTSLSFSDGATSSSDSVSFDASFTGGATLGYQITDRFSLEGELTYRRNEFGQTELPGLGTFTGGDFASLGFGISALYRFPIGQSGKLSGYVGPGYVYLQEIDIDFDDASQQEVSFESDDGGFQLKLGARYDVSERWFIEAGATYFAGGSVTMELPADSSQTIAADYDHWSASIGAGFRF